MRVSVSMRRLAVVATAAIAVVTVTSPAWGAFPEQGNRILYARGREGGAPTVARRGIGEEFDLFSIRNNGSDRMRVTDSNVIEYGGYYSPDGDQIVYWARVGGDDYRIYRADADGGHRDALTSNRVSVHPNWSKNGKKIVYARYPGATVPELGAPFEAAPLPRRGGSGDLMVMDADGTGKHSILSASVLSPGWSPTRAEIAYSASTKGGYAIFLIPPGGGKPTIVCCKGGNALFADWSPNGNRLLFTYVPPTSGPSTPTVFSIRRDGTDPIPITDQSYFLTTPRYSNDGDRVIFSRSIDETLDLYSSPADGSGGMRRLTDTPKWLEILNLLLV